MEVTMEREMNDQASFGSESLTNEVIFDDMLKCLIRSGWLFIVILSAVCTLTALAVRRTYHPRYEASSTFIVTSMNNNGHDRNTYNSAVTSQLGNVFPYLLDSDLMLKLVAEDLGMTSVPGRISSEIMEGTSLITIKVSAAEGRLAYDILQSVIKNYPEVSEYVIGDIDMKLMDETGIPSDPVNRRPTLKYLLIVTGVCLGGFLLFLYLYAITRMTIRSESDLKNLFNVPVLGTVPRVYFKKRSKKQVHRIAVDEKSIPYFFVESLRTIRNRLERESSENGLKSVLVTSALPSEGKSTVAVNLAISLAHKGRSVILVDADLRNPSIADIAGIKDIQKGVNDLLGHTASLEEVLVTYEKNARLRILPSHGSNKNPTELLSSQETGSIIQKLCGMADFVIIDTPPSAVVSDASVVAKYVDGAVFIVRQDFAKLDSLQEGMDMLTGTGVHMVGTIMNNTESGVFSKGYGYGYYSYSRYGHYGRGGYYGKYGYYGRHGYGYGYGYGNAASLEQKEMDPELDKHPEADTDQEWMGTEDRKGTDNEPGQGEYLSKK